MKVTLLGLGGSMDTLTMQAKAVLENAGLVLGAKRLLEDVPETAVKIACYMPNEQLEHIKQYQTDTCVVYSGDTGFYSGAKGLIPLLESENIEYNVIAGLSSVQLLSAAVGMPWQDWKLVSAHGTKCDPVCEMMDGRTVFFLTGGSTTPESICRQLTDAELGGQRAVIGEALSYPEQNIARGTVAELTNRESAKLAVLLVEGTGRAACCAPGIADERFMRGGVPMTKREIRALIPQSLGLRPEDTVWDVGAGTGSVSVELALTAHRGRTYAIECSAEGCELIRANRERFGAWNLSVVEGRAPQALEALPTPDAVFIGGTKGSMEGILDIILERNPRARICISAIAVETLGRAVCALSDRGISAQVTQISASRSRAVGGLHMMMANNPVFLITGGAE